MRMFISLVLCASIFLAGCSMPKLRMPRVHKITVQQGNVITQEMIDRLKPGMARSQVAFIMGEPVFKNAFDDNRWDYVYTIDLPDVFSKEQRVSLFFVEDMLAYFTGDLYPTEPEEEEDVATDIEEAPDDDPGVAEDDTSTSDWG